MPAITAPPPASADVGLVGLAVMGQNLALNIADHGYKIAVYNRTTARTEEFIAENPPGVFESTGGGLVPAADLADFARSIKRPRRIVVMVQAGGATDAVIESILPLLDEGDLIVDGGNALFTDTNRRQAELEARGVYFIGSGVSGGETGARFGPSLMPGGSVDAWPLLEPVWKAIAAKVDPQTGKPIEGSAPGRPITSGSPCTVWIGPGGAGHFVKMIHNGIEYADMQLIAEAYDFMRGALALSTGDMARVFGQWNEGDLDSFLIEITADILKQQDPVTGHPFVDVVLDAAGQKGTGKWTVEASLDLGVAAPSIAEAVFARTISSIKEERVAASKVIAPPELPEHSHSIGSGEHDWVGCVRDALYCSKICVYAQGFALMSAASREHEWSLDLGAIASIFRGGCIIRARFLQKITAAYTHNPGLPNLLLDPYFAGVVEATQRRWRSVVARAAVQGVPVPAIGSALSYFDSYRSAKLPANLIQAQRDYFGAHTYERVDKPRGRRFHLDWPHPDRPQVGA